MKCGCLLETRRNRRGEMCVTATRSAGWFFRLWERGCEGMREKVRKEGRPTLKIVIPVHTIWFLSIPTSRPGSWWSLQSQTNGDLCTEYNCSLQMLRSKCAAGQKAWEFLLYNNYEFHLLTRECWMRITIFNETLTNLVVAHCLLPSSGSLLTDKKSMNFP